MLHPEFETLPAKALRQLQEELWREQWIRVRATSAFYKRKFDNVPSKPPTLEALWSSQDFVETL
jgi:phenylacetate-coenzyme A ligase PaaK-like adenylate-forming protein